MSVLRTLRVTFSDAHANLGQRRHLTACAVNAAIANLRLPHGCRLGTCTHLNSADCAPGGGVEA